MTITVLMYTFGMASGHLSRINAVYKGFLREKILCNFLVIAPRSKYLSYLEKGIQLITEENAPESVDIFICDWKATTWILSLSPSYSKYWVGLRRLGTIKSDFPSYFDHISIEPGVKSNIMIWPIISTWKDELVTHEEFHDIIDIPVGEKIMLLCENGAYSSHPESVLNKEFESGDFQRILCSNSPYYKKDKILDYYPVARLFSEADHIVLGAGYNSVHEAICFSSKDKVSFIIVGGDDQNKRITKIEEFWKNSPGDSQANVLARYIYEKYLCL